MIETGSIIGITAVVTVFLAVIMWLIFGRKKRNDQEISNEISTLKEIIKELQESNIRQMKDIKSDVAEHLKSSQESMNVSTKQMSDRAEAFTTSITKMGEDLRNVHESVNKSTEKMSSFQDIFKTPKLRGQWGETNLQYYLEQTYSKERVLRQHYFKSNEAVDFALKLPNDLLLPIDSKFSNEVYISYAEESVAEEKERKRKRLLDTIKGQIDDISSKYVKPDELTTDVAIMYIPAEKIYYELMFSSQGSKISEYGWKKRVMLVSPNTLYLTIHIIEHWYRDVTVGKKTKDIIKKLAVILKDGNKLGDSFNVLGKHINNTRGAYEDSEKRLGLLTGRVEKVIEIGGTKKGDQELSDKLPPSNTNR